MSKHNDVQPVEWYIERLFPALRPKYIRTEEDEDICQIVLCDMVRKWERLCVTTDEEFIDIFSRFYGTRKWIERGRRARQLVSGTYWLTHPGGIPTRYLGYNKQHGHGRTLEFDLAIPSTTSLTTQYTPWSSDRIEALEWIERLPTPLYRRLFFLYFIEGYTLSEIGKLLNWPRERVGLVIKEGVVCLQVLYKQDCEEEGRSANVGPTLQLGIDE